MNILPTDRTEVLNLINEWNSTRLDLFKINEPNEVLDFYGVIRFYFQDSNNKITTKCIRVANTATTIDIIRVLIEKLRPDMKILPNEKDFYIYEIHSNGEGRKLEMNEKPLWIQLYWGKDQREGRFILQNIKSINERQSSRKHDKKNSIDENDTQIPIESLSETNKFIRSLSNSEMVKKLQQNRLKQKFIKISTKQGGGTMKIFGDELNPSIPYKTFLLSIKDTAEWVVKEMLEKYGLKHENPQNYCLIQIIIPSLDQMKNKTIKEIILHDKECPLNIYLNYIQKNKGSIIFKIIKCPSEYIQIRKQFYSNIIQTPSIQDRTINDHLPMFIEINNDGTDLLTPRVFKLHPNTTYVGRNSKSGKEKQYFYIDRIGINHDHCTIQNENGIVTLFPYGEIWLNKKLITIPFILQHGSLICFGGNSTFCYYDPQFVQKKKQNGEKLNLYNSSSIIPMNELNKTNNFQLEVQPKKISPTNIIDQGTKINILPGLLEVPVEAEIQFLHTVFDNYPLNNIHFRLSPVYTLYMTLRYRLSSFGKSNLSFIQKQEDVISLLYRIEDMINKKIEECQEYGDYLVYWLANISEFLYFLKNDQDLSKISYDIQIHLIESIQHLFYYLINFLQNQLNKYLIGFINPQDNIEQNIHQKLSDKYWITLDKNLNKSTLNDILIILSSIMNLLRKCRVNATLTIQIFSKIFHYINTWLFNRIIFYPELKLCSYIWGEKLLYRLKFIHNWAQKQGLELVSEYYLMKINQLCLLLISRKCNAYDVQKFILNNTFKINSIQIKQILNNYILSKNEPPISNDFSQTLISSAYKYVDENLHREGFVIQLAEETDLNLPFLLPKDGYTCENLRGIPQQLFEFIEPMTRLGLCRLFTNPHSLGMWTEFMEISNIENRNDDNDRIETLVLNKKGNSLGLSIVAAKSESQQFQGIYIKSIIPGGAAEDDGHLQPGDQILSVDQISLIDITQEQAAETLKQSGPSVTLQILKDAANRHGLSALLTTPSENHHELAIPYQYPSSIHALQITNNHEQLSGIPEHLAILTHQSRLIPISEDLTQTNHYISQQHQSNPNIFYSKQIYKQQSDNHENNFIRSTNQTQSFTNRNIIQPLVFREDIRPNQNRNHQIKSISTIPPKTLPKPMISTIALIKQTNSTNDVDISSRLSSTSPLQKSRTDQQEPIKLSNTHQNNKSEIHLKPINNLLTKINRTEQEEKELNNLKLADEFDHRVKEYHFQTNGNNNQEISSSSSNEIDEMNEFDEKLKRRLEQFEQEREIERAHINRMLTKHTSYPQEYEIRTNHDIHELKTQRMSEEDRTLEAKKEQARLLKYIRLSNSIENDDQLSSIQNIEHIKTF